MPSVNFINRRTPITAEWLNDVDAKVFAYVNLSDAQFGVVGDGVADDTSALQNAIDYAISISGELRGVPGQTYRVTTPLVANGALRFDLQGATIDGSDIAADVTLNTTTVLKVTGSINSSINLSANCNTNSSTLTLTSTSGLAKNDVLLLSSTQLMVDSYGGTTLRGELVKIKSIDSATQITLYGVTAFSYTTASTANVKKINILEDVVISNGTIIAGGAGTLHSGLQIWYAEAPRVVNVNISHCDDCGIATYYCLGGRIDGGRISNITTPGGATSTGYGISLYYATADFVIDGVEFTNARRAVTGGGLYAALYCTTQNCVVRGGFNGLGNHEPCFWWNILNNTVIGVDEVAYQIRGQYTKLIGNKAIAPGIYGVRVRTFATNPNGITGTEIIDTEIINPGSYGIWLDGDSTNGRVNKTIISGGKISNSGDGNIFGRRVSDVTISNMVLDGQSILGTTDGNGISFSGSTTSGDRCERITVSNVHIPAPLRNGLQFRYCDEVNVSNCLVTDAASTGLFAFHCTRVTVNGGMYEANGSNFSYGNYFQNTNSATVSGVTFIGLSSLTGAHAVVCQSTSSEDCLDHVITGCNMHDWVKAVFITGTGANYSVVVGNNGRSCSSGTKFDVSSASQSLANNLS